MCIFYVPGIPKACREDDAEEVKEKEHPNFCDYFRPAADAWDAKSGATAIAAKADLGALFGDAVSGSGDASKPDLLLEDAEDLFGKD